MRRRAGRLELRVRLNILNPSFGVLGLTSPMLEPAGPCSQTPKGWTAPPLRQTVGHLNLIVDMLETFPASRPALLAIDARGERRVWHFGELIAMSAGLSGA